MTMKAEPPSIQFILIIGALSGDGPEAARALARQHGSLVLWAADARALDATLSGLPDTARGMVVDLGRQDQVRGAAAGLQSIDIILSFETSALVEAELQSRYPDARWVAAADWQSLTDPL